MNCIWQMHFSFWLESFNNPHLNHSLTKLASWKLSPPPKKNSASWQISLSLSSYIFSADSKNGHFPNYRIFKIYPLIQYLILKKNKNFYLQCQKMMWWMPLPVERPTFIQTFLWRVLNWYKTIKLCELSTGYLWSFLVYTGVKTELWSSLTDPSKNKTPAMALNITEPLLQWPHIADGQLFQFSISGPISENKSTNFVGTLHVKRKKYLLLSNKKNSRKEKLFGNNW